MSVRRHDSRVVFPRSVGPALYYSESSAALPSFTFQFPQLITCHSAKPFASYLTFCSSFGSMFLFYVFLLLLRCDVSVALQVRNGSAATLTALGAQKRAPLVTRFSSIFFSGDASKSRTAEVGFNARVDIDRRLWGFCPIGVFVASDCGLAGNCVDRHAWSKGCGKGSGLTTFTWYLYLIHYRHDVPFADSL